MTALRIGFDVTSAAKLQQRGIAVYVRSLLEALPAAAPEARPVLFLRDGRRFRSQYVADLLPAAPRRWLLGPLGRASAGLDAFHGLGVHLPARARVPRSFTLHDLRVLDDPESSRRGWAAARGARIRETVARADGVLLLSAHGRERLAHHFPEFPMERSAVTPLAVDHGHFRPLGKDETGQVLLRHGINRPYLLQVGQLAPHKNAAASLHAFRASQASAGGLLLVFAGGAVAGHREELEALAGRLGVAAQVRWLGGVPYADLPALYGGAEAVLVPSHYEGFGLPVLEAMACGAAGVAASATSLPEVAGGAWPLAQPGEPEAFARHLDRILVDVEFAARTREAALAQAARFTWGRCARQTVDFLARLAAGVREA